MIRSVSLSFVLVFFVCGAASTQTGDSRKSADTAPSTLMARSTPPNADDSAELAALQTDAARMRSLILQMQNNMAFVGTTTAPLYHQFELEVALWQLQLADMDRRLAALQKSRRSSSDGNH